MSGQEMFYVSCGLSMLFGVAAWLAAQEFGEAIGDVAVNWLTAVGVLLVGFGGLVALLGPGVVS